MNSLTPSSQPGCHLHDPAAKFSQGNHVDSKVTQHSCLLNAPHDSVVNLKHYQQGQFNRTTHYHVSHEIGSSHVNLPFHNLPPIQALPSLSLSHAHLQLGFISEDSLVINVLLTLPCFFMKSLFSAISFDNMLLLQQ